MSGVEISAAEMSAQLVRYTELVWFGLMAYQPLKAM